MKKLFIARHAKSSWNYPDLSDFKRPLNKRGKRDAPFMGQLLFDTGRIPDLIISSPAVRAYITAKTIAAKIQYPLENLVTSELLYHGDNKDMLRVIKGVDPKLNSVMIFGHNPGLTILSNYLSGSNIDNIPTTGIVEIDFDINNWNEINSGSGKLINFEYPKKYPH